MGEFADLTFQEFSNHATMSKSKFTNEEIQSHLDELDDLRRGFQDYKPNRNPEEIIQPEPETGFIDYLQMALSVVLVLMVCWLLYKLFMQAWEVRRRKREQRVFTTVDSNMYPTLTEEVHSTGPRVYIRV